MMHSEQISIIETMDSLVIRAFRNNIAERKVYRVFSIFFSNNGIWYI